MWVYGCVCLCMLDWLLLKNLIWSPQCIYWHDTCMSATSVAGRETERSAPSRDRRTLLLCRGQCSDHWPQWVIMSTIHIAYWNSNLTKWESDWLNEKATTAMALMQRSKSQQTEAQIKMISENMQSPHGLYFSFRWFSLIRSGNHTSNLPRCLGPHVVTRPSSCLRHGHMEWPGRPYWHPISMLILQPCSLIEWRRRQPRHLLPIQVQLPRCVQSMTQWRKQPWAACAQYFSYSSATQMYKYGLNGWLVRTRHISVNKFVRSQNNTVNMFALMPWQLHGLRFSRQSVFTSTQARTRQSTKAKCIIDWEAHHRQKRLLKNSTVIFLLTNKRNIIIQRLWNG